MSLIIAQPCEFVAANRSRSLINVICTFRSESFAVVSCSAQRDPLISLSNHSIMFLVHHPTRVNCTASHQWTLINECYRLVSILLTSCHIWSNVLEIKVHFWYSITSIIIDRTVVTIRVLKRDDTHTYGRAIIQFQQIHKINLLLRSILDYKTSTFS